MPTLALLVLGCQPELRAQSQAALSLKGGVLARTEIVIDNPAGQTRRIEYKRGVQIHPIRIDFVRLFTGRMVLGQTVIREDEHGHWLLINQSSSLKIQFVSSTKELSKACQSTPTSTSKSVVNVISTADFLVEGTPWRAHITHIYEQTKPQAGISTETEAAVDIIACKLEN
jgi:hypothetical protein